MLQGFRLILGRELSDEGAIEAHMRISNVAELRQVLLNSEEFQGKYKVMHPGVADHPGLSAERETVVFLHLEKTGGTSLRTMLESAFALERRCPIRDNRLHLLSVAELGRYDFFAGHFDWPSIGFIPRNNIKTVTLFREPSARLVSYYRFLRSHPVSDEFAGDWLMRLAHESTAEEFFECPKVRALPVVYNNYLIALGGSFLWFEQRRTVLSRADCARALAEAKRNISGLTAVGITERFEQSAQLMGSALNLQSLPVQKAFVTDDLAIRDPRFRRVDSVLITPRLQAALHELVLYDNELYHFAINEFESRYIRSGVRNAH